MVRCFELVLTIGFEFEVWRVFFVFCNILPQDLFLVFRSCDISAAKCTPRKWNAGCVLERVSSDKSELVTFLPQDNAT